ncbi:hypothetical protein B0O80DRAFT_434763 [Mortierella sp. GBAus27b]|nr:hypothetical protein B0O80DRAFT_434763 [Mortierella sp. GBAus27b]
MDNILCRSASNSKKISKRPQFDIFWSASNNRWFWKPVRQRYFSSCCYWSIDSWSCCCCHSGRNRISLRNASQTCTKERQFFNP